MQKEVRRDDTHSMAGDDSYHHAGAVTDDLLTDREALIVQLHYADGWSLRRIARGIGVDEKSVRRSHHSALAHLRACCQSEQGPFDVPMSALMPEDSRG